MIYTEVPQGAVSGAWGDLWRLLGPAVAHDTTETETSVREALIAGRMTVWLVSGEATGVVVTRIDDDDGPKTARLHYVAGRSALSHMKQILADFEAGARAIGCKRIRCAGRKGWARVTGYDELDSDNDTRVTGSDTRVTGSDNGHVELVKVL